MPLVGGISVKFRSIRNRCNVRTISKTEHILLTRLMKTARVRDETMYVQYSTCGKRYIGETGDL
jgi:hypothetical protein